MPDPTVPGTARPAAQDVTAAHRRWIGAVVFAVVVGGFLGLFAHSVADPDIFGHIRYGLDILRHGTPDVADRYSYLTGGRRWFDHEWGTELLVALVWQRGREAGLMVLKAAFASVILLLALRPLLRLAGGVRVALVALPALVLLFLRIVPIRAQLFSEALFVILLLALTRVEEGDRRALLIVPPVLLLWANLHGSFIMGAGLLAGWVVVHAWERRTIPRAALLAVAAAELATLANPWGGHLHLFLLRTATVPRPDIVEWGPLALASTTGVAYLLALGAAAAGLAWSPAKKHAGLWAILGAVAVLPLIAARHADYFALAALVIAGPHTLRALERAWPGGTDRLTVMEVGPLVAIAAVASFAAAPFPARCLDVLPGMTFPMRAARALRALDRPANVATPFDWGEYVSFVAGPRIRVSNDGRRETIYADSTRIMGWNYDRGVAGWAEVLGRGTDLALVRTGSRTDTLMSGRGDWREAYADPTAAIYVPTGSPLGGRLAAAGARIAASRVPANGMGTCLVDGSAPPSSTP